MMCYNQTQRLLVPERLDIHSVAGERLVEASLASWVSHCGISELTPTGDMVADVLILPEAFIRHPHRS